MRRGSVPPGLPPSTADTSTLRGIAAERLDLEALHREGRISREALAVGLEVLAMMARMRRRAELQRR